MPSSNFGIFVCDLEVFTILTVTAFDQKLLRVSNVTSFGLGMDCQK